MRALLRRLSLATAATLLLALAIPAALLYFLAFTESGLQFVVARIPERIGKIERVRIEGAQGTLAGGFRVARLELRQERVALRIEGASGRLRMLPLLWQSIAPEDVRVEVVHLTLRPALTPPRRPPRFLPRFLSVDARTVRVDALTLVPLKGQPLEFRDISAAGLLRSTTLRIYNAQASLLDLRLSATGLLTAAEPLRAEGSARAEWKIANQPRWLASAEFRGDLDRVSFSGQLLEPFRADLRDGALDATAPWSIRANTWIRDFDLRDFGGSGFLGEVSGNLALEIDAAGYRARGPLLAPGLGAGKLAVDFDGSFAQRVLSVRRLVVNHPVSGARVEARGEIGLVPEDGPRLGLKGEWKNFRWPLMDTRAAVRSSVGSFALAGTWPYRLDTEATVEAATLPPIRGRLSGQLARDRLIVSSSTIALFDGTAKLAGEVQWKPAERWRFSGPVRGLNPARLRPDLPGSLDFQLAARGEGFSARAPIDLEFRQLQGRLRGARARGSGRIGLAGDQWSFRKVDFAAGGLRLALDGTLTPAARNLEFRIDASDLSFLAPESRGTLRASGTLRGTPAVPVLKLSADGSDLLHQGIAVGRLDADVDFDPRPRQSSAVTVAIRDLSAGGRTAQRIDFRLDGQSEQHRVSLAAVSDALALQGSAAGRFDAGAWEASWDRLDLDVGDRVKLVLADALRMTASASKASVERFCLRSEGNSLTTEARLCGEGQWDPQAWSSRLTLTRLPLDALTAGMAERATLEGMVDLSARASASRDGPILGELRADLSGTQLRRQRVTGKEDLVPLGAGYITLESTPDAIKGRIELDAGQMGSVEGSLDAARPASDTPLADLPLQAELRARTSALGLLNLYVPELDRASGDLDADFVIGGTIGAPLLNGVLRLSKGELDLYQVNMALRDVSLEARLIDNGFSFKGAARAGTGSIDAEGKLTWKDREPNGELRVKGQDLLLADVPEARVTASPDLRFRVAGRDLEATGTVIVPYARLVPADLAGAVLPSSDELIVGNTPRDPNSTFRVTSNIKLVLGERVTIDALGLTGRLAGSITAQTLPDGTSRGSGELGVAEGKYAALGRRLDIERGRLIFSGGLLGDPGIDIRATKEFPDVKAGVNVRGTLREPRMTFFSEPSLPQSQIVSLILAGGTLESAQAASGGNAGRDALIAQGGAILAQQLGNRIGIEDVGIEQNLSNETSLVLGKYLSPRLYVSYGISFAEAINTLKMRYTINDRWTLRTEAGKEQSAEIVYTIERD